MSLTSVLNSDLVLSFNTVLYSITWLCLALALASQSRFFRDSLGGNLEIIYGDRGQE